MDVQVQFAMLIKFALAAFFGGLIGLEREYSDKPAGLRTHMLVAGASALFVTLGAPLLDHLDVGARSSLLQADPIRILQAIVIGIGFLGAGTIMRGEGVSGVEGLTTAASVFLCAAVGMGVALEQYILAAGVTILTVIILTFLRQVERAIWRIKRWRREEFE